MENNQLSFTMNQDNFQVCIENFKKFVNKVFSGGNPNQKAILLKECQNVVKIAQESKKSNMEAVEFFPDEEMIKTELPNEIWLKIIGFLETKDVFGNFALVCKRFNSLILQPTAIKRFAIDFKNIDQDNWPKLIALLNNYKTMTELSMKEACFSNVITWIPKVLRSNPCLKSLKFLDHSKWNCTCAYRIDEFIQCIKTHRNDLENLELDSIDYGSEAVKDICTLKNLRSLKISKHSGSLNSKLDFIIDLATNCEYLDSIAFNSMNCYSTDINRIRTAWNHFLGQRSKTLKSIDINVSLKPHPSQQYYEPPASLANLKLCKNLENVTLEVDDQDITMLLNLPKVKKLVLKRTHYADTLLLCFQSMDLSNLRYLSISFIINDNGFQMNESTFLTELSTIEFPVLERLYYNPINLSNSMDQKVCTSLIENAPKLKAIQFGRNGRYNLTNRFLFDIFKHSNVCVFFEDSLRQLELENYFRNSRTLHYEKYQEMKLDFMHWFQGY